MSELVERFPLLVAEATDTVVGWAGLSQRPRLLRRRRRGERLRLPGARGIGVGTTLAEALAAEAEHRGFHKLVGKLFSDNVASIRLCGRCSFSEVGVHRRHGQLDGEWRDVLVVERLLGEALASAS